MSFTVHVGAGCGFIGPFLLGELNKCGDGLTQVHRGLIYEGQSPRARVISIPPHLLPKLGVLLRDHVQARGCSAWFHRRFSAAAAWRR
jgi:hypothetical protein